MLADEYWGESGQSSLKYASEAHLLKPGTDVVLVGEAWAPKGRPVPSSLVSVKVGALRKVIQVFGDRRWKGGSSSQPSSPEPFLRMPLTYERAYGGVHAVDASEARCSLSLGTRWGVAFGGSGVRPRWQGSRCPIWRIPSS